jgi:hypothetical protein
MVLQQQAHEEPWHMPVLTVQTWLCSKGATTTK